MTVRTYILGMYKTNCYMIFDAGGHAVVIDPADRCGYLLSKLEERGLTLERILLTHAHFDHMLAADELRKHTGAHLCVHGLDEQGLKDPEISYMRQLGRVNEGFCADVCLSDGADIEFGEIRIKVIHTPGHTQGSVCYVIGKDVFCGDLVFKDGYGRCDLYGGNESELVRSIKRLRAFFEENGADYTLRPGHGDKLKADEFLRKTDHFIHF
ncbi:MAG: MBL fold metallo-hydrolase [Clostridia bacterium]|nr:MBL fold metallo-hydrolase [Clostridia bacterium]